MKRLRILVAVILIFTMLIFVAPAAADTVPSPTSTCTINQGIEIFPGLDIGGNNYGATFVAQVSNTGGKLDGTNGVLRASINYYGTDPVPPVTDIFGGNWTLTVTKNGKAIGTVIGRVLDGAVGWSDPGGTGNPTAVGTVHLDLSIIGGTYPGITRGRGSYFDGADIHESGVYIGNIQVPIVQGTLNLVY